ncbi:MAG TPA: outer membrane beta-barrel domain-containing protein [Bacteriovoracaceae bacterium]|nr:outer membrane beta-barrel domain-containing protein [Bacteriovoracaceae bacterium]
MKLALFLLTFFTLPALAVESSLYDFSWLDKDKEIYVLQNRRFKKDKEFYVGATGAMTLSGAFIDSYGGTLRAGYFFKEDWGLELVFGKNTGEENDTAKAVKEQGTVPYYRKIDTYTGAMFMWSPFYSKINTFNKIFYFDWMFGLGAANIKTLDNRNKFDTAASNSNTLTSENTFGAMWNTGFRFYIDERWSVRVDVTGLLYKADKSKQSGGSSSPVTTASKIYNSYDLGIGLNYQF